MQYAAQYAKQPSCSMLHSMLQYVSSMLQYAAVCHCCMQQYTKQYAQYAKLYASMLDSMQQYTSQYAQYVCQYATVCLPVCSSMH